jgi:hypothetical protein
VIREKPNGNNPHTPGVLYGCENKGVVGKGIRKGMKIKGEEEWAVGSE